jgi:hypothetical protein
MSFEAGDVNFLRPRNAPRPGGLSGINRGTERRSLMSKNIVAAIIIVVILIGGGAALYKLDTGQGDRTSSSVTAKAASD